MRMLLSGLCAAALSFALGCSKDDPSGKSEVPAASAEAAAPGEGHAPAGVAPGSHEDWCGEHAVPESQCTRCNSSLVPAFKATGDWCDEHGLPDSQCTKCNPGLKIERPAKPAGG